MGGGWCIGVNNILCSCLCIQDGVGGCKGVTYEGCVTILLSLLREQNNLEQTNGRR